MYHLGRMRASPQYRREVEVARMRELAHDKYRMAGTVGDQVKGLRGRVGSVESAGSGDLGG